MTKQEKPQPLAGSAKGSGCRLPQMEGIMASDVD